MSDPVPTNEVMTDGKTATYICGGCSLTDRLDLDRLENIARSENNGDLVRRHDFLCSSEGTVPTRHDWFR